MLHAVSPVYMGSSGYQDVETDEVHDVLSLACDLTFTSPRSGFVQREK